MGSIRYLNAVLTILTIVMSLQLWTTWTGASSEPQRVAALEPTAALAAGIPDAGAQRKQMIDLLKQLVKATETQTELFKSGQARVRLESRPKDDEATSKEN